MRIKEEFKRAGVFWLPSTPERQVPGTLSISDGGNVELELAQPLDISSLQAIFGYSPDDSLSQIIGHVEKVDLLSLIDAITCQRNAILLTVD